MGMLAKLVAFVVIQAATYVGVAALVSAIASLAPLLGFSPVRTPYTRVLGEAVLFLCSVCVLTFFTVPATLGMFGLGGAWFRRVVAKSAKGLAGSSRNTEGSLTISFSAPPLGRSQTWTSLRVTESQSTQSERCTRLWSPETATTMC